MQNKATKPLHVTPLPSPHPKTQNAFTMFFGKKEIPNWGRAGFMRVIVLEKIHMQPNHSIMKVCPNPTCHIIDLCWMKVVIRWYEFNHQHTVPWNLNHPRIACESDIRTTYISLIGRAIWPRHDNSHQCWNRKLEIYLKFQVDFKLQLEIRLKFQPDFKLRFQQRCEMLKLANVYSMCVGPTCNAMMVQM